MPPTSRPKLKPVSKQIDTMKGAMNELKELHAKYDHMIRKLAREEEEVRLQFTSIGNCLSEYRPRLERIENNTKNYHQRLNIVVPVDCPYVHRAAGLPLLTTIGQ